MRAFLVIFILFIRMVSLAHSEELNVDVLLHCIATVESNDVSTKIGRAGERSKYQMMPQTWDMYSKTDFVHLSEEMYQVEVEMVARKHINTIKKSLSSRRMEITVYNIALAWNGGPNKKIYTDRNKNYAVRVNNLYDSVR